MIQIGFYFGESLANDSKERVEMEPEYPLYNARQEKKKEVRAAFFIAHG